MLGYVNEVEVTDIRLAISETSYGPDDPFRYKYTAWLDRYGYEVKRVTGYGKTPSEAMDKALSMKTPREEEE